MFVIDRQYLGSNMSVNVQTVNDPWLFSVLWCSGVTSVSSEAPNILKDVPYPIWLLVGLHLMELISV